MVENNLAKDWQLVSFEEVVEGFGTGMTPFRGNSKYWKGKIPWVTSGELNYNVITATKEHVTNKALSETSLKILAPNTLLIAITGLEAEGTRGSCALLGIEATTNQSCLYLLPKNKTNIKYVYYYYQFVGDQLGLNYAQGTKQQSFTGKIVRKLPIRIPKEDYEQTAIATALCDMDGLISATKKLIAKKEAIKQGMMQELLSGKKRLPGFSQEWEEKTVDEFAKAVIGGSTPSTKISKFWNGDIDWYTPTEIGNFKYTSTSKRKISEAGLKTIGNRLLPTGTVLFTSRATIGDVAIVTKNCCTNQGFQSIVPLRVEFSEFLYYLLIINKKKFIENSHGSTFSEISPSNVKNVEVRIPSDDNEIIAIGNVLKDCDEEIIRLKQKLQKFTELKHGMMQELLTGRTRLVRPKSKYELEDKVLSMAAEPSNEELFTNPTLDKEKEAALLAMLVGKNNLRLGRFRYQKLMYLFHRKTDNAISGWLNKAAGPYNHDLRYRGVEDMVVTKGWCTNTSQDPEHPRFEKGSNYQEAKQQFLKHYTITPMNWMKRHFLFEKDNELELLATVDKARLARARNKLSANWRGIKEYIAQEPEWEDKLKKLHFSDENLKRAVGILGRLFEYE